MGCYERHVEATAAQLADQGQAKVVEVPAGIGYQQHLRGKHLEILPHSKRKGFIRETPLPISSEAFLTTLPLLRHDKEILHQGYGRPRVL